MPDLRNALRSLASTPTLTLAVVLSLGIGIGANSTVFTCGPSSRPNAGLTPISDLVGTTAKR